MNLRFADKEQVLVAGYPRSGNTYLSRLLGEILNAPVTGAYSAVPLATEGLNRDGTYVVRQLHLRPRHCFVDDVAVASGWKFCVNEWTTERIVNIIRDPRDIAVSAFYYWKMQSLSDTINSMVNGIHPLKGVGSWSRFVHDWNRVYENESNHLISFILYKDLLKDPFIELLHLIHTLEIEADKDVVRSAIENQSINKKRSQIQEDGDSRPYGKSIQLHHLRKGIAGDWRNHFTYEHRKLASVWQSHLEELGYEIDDGWINEESNRI